MERDQALGKIFAALRDTTLLIFVLGLVAYGGAYFVDSRLCQKFGLPLEFVSIGMDDVYLLGRIFISLFFGFFSVVASIFALYIFLRFVAYPLGRGWGNSRFFPRRFVLSRFSRRAVLRHCLNDWLKAGRTVSATIGRETEFMNPFKVIFYFMTSIVLVIAVVVFIAVESGSLDGPLLFYRHSEAGFGDCVPVKKYRELFVCVEFSMTEGRRVARDRFRLVSAEKLNLIFDGRPLQPPEIFIPKRIREMLTFSL